MNYKDREPAARRLVADLIGSKEIVIHKELTAPKTIYFTGHLESPRRDIADGRLDVVRDPLHQVGRVLLLESGLRIRTPHLLQGRVRIRFEHTDAKSLYYRSLR